MRMTLAAVAALSLPVVPPAFAATGMAWDSVTKMSTGDAAPQPGNFASDFAAASQPAASPQQRGGLFGGIAAGALAGAGGMIAAMQNGTAAHNYVAGSFRRTDDVGSQTATILDCSARTLTSLDLAKKTYRVTSLDAPRPSTGAGSAGAPAGRGGGTPFQDDGSKIAIAFVTTPLGPKTIDTVPTDGYQFAMTTTMTKPSGESQSAQMQMTSYFSAFATPNLACSAAGAAAAVPGLPAMAMYRQIMDAMQTSSGDPRITVTSSGPAAPTGKLPLFTAITPKAQGGRGGFAMTIENGNVHQVSDTDKSIFGVPPDFTKLP
jgi:hypothetical protein